LKGYLLKASVVMAVALLALAVIAVNEADEGDAGVGDTFDVGILTYTVLDGDNHVSVKMKDPSIVVDTVVIPDSVNYKSNIYTPTEIAENGFYGNASIAKVAVPSTLVKIGDHAFDGCTSLMAVTESVSSEYTAVEYIECSGTQYIDTGIKPSAQLNVIVSFSHKSFNSENMVLGASSSTLYKDGIHYVLDVSNNKTQLAFGKTVKTGSVVFSANTIYTANINEDHNGSLRINGTLDVNVPGETQFPDCNLFLFIRNINGTADPNSTYHFIGKIYSCIMYEGDVLVRDFVPCICKSTGAIGMYDRVSNQFFENLGTGSFVAGSEQSIIKGASETASGISLPHVTVIGDYAFNGVSAVERVNLPEVISVGDYAFSGFTDIESITGTSADIRQSIPLEYTQVEYIQATGSQYIDTGFNLRGHEFQFKYRSTGSSNIWFGANSGGYETMIAYKGNLNYLGGKNSTYSYAAGTDYTFLLRSVPGDYLLTVNGVTSISSTGTGSSPDINAYILGGRNATGGSTINGMSGICYYFKIYEGTTLVFDGVPCLSSSGGAGMYDTVSGRFFGNSGTGSFTAGPVVQSGFMYVPKVTSVGDYAFSGCTSLITAQLDKVTSTGSHLFDGCTALKFIGFDSLKDVGEGTFMGSGVEIVSTDEKYKASDYHPAFSRLPDGYTELEYIQSTGTQWINTNIKATDAYAVETYVKPTKLCKNFQGYMGNKSADDFGIGSTDSLNSMYSRKAGTEIARVSFSTTDFNQVTIKDGSWQFGSNKGSVNTTTASLGTQGTYIYLFSGHTDLSSRASGCQMKEVKFYASDNATLLGDFVPCTRSDGVIGMYDMVTGVFFANSGSNSFTAGPTVATSNIPDKETAYLPLAETIGASAFEGCTGLVQADFKNVVSVGNSAFKDCTGLSGIGAGTSEGSKLPAGYIQVEYIESTGTQYINTGIVPSATNQRFVYSAMITKNSGNAGVVNQMVGSGMWFNLRMSSSGEVWCATYDSGHKTGIKFDNNVVYQIDFKFRQYLKVDGATIISGNYNNPSSSAPFHLFAAYDINAKAVENRSDGMRLYSFHVYSNTDECVMELIPCIRSDGAVGMYDTVSQQFFGNSGDGQFLTGESLFSVSMPSVKTLGASAFEGCTGLGSVDLPDLKSAGASAFKGCTTLLTVNLPSIESVADHAFDGCTALNDARFDKVTSLGESAFEGCDSIEYVGSNAGLPTGYTRVEYIRSSGTQYIDTLLRPSSAFEFETKLYSKNQSGMVFMGGGAASGNQIVCFVNPNEGKVSGRIHNNASVDDWNVSGIGFSQPFTYSLQDYNVYYNGSVIASDITHSTFDKIGANLTLFKRNYDSGSYPSFYIGDMYYMKIWDNGVLVFDGVPCKSPSGKAGMYDLVTNKFFGSSSANDFVAGPEYMTGVYMPLLQTIGERAFSGCDNLIAIGLPEVKTVSKGAFIGTTSLQIASLPSATNVGSSAFAGCTNLSEITLSETSDCTIGDEAFLNAGKDTANGFTMKALFFNLGTKVFGGTKINSINSGTSGSIIMNSIPTLPEETFVGMTGATNFEANIMVAILGDAFKNTSIQTVSVPICKNIGSNAFYGCVNLTTFTMSSAGGGTLDSYAFYGVGTSTSQGTTFTGEMRTLSEAVFKNSKLKSINGDASFDFNLNGIQRIYTHAFEGSNVTTVNIPVLEGMDKEVFTNCENLTSIVFNDKYAGKIDNNTFYGCKSLQSVTAKGVTVVGDSAFKSCGELETVLLSDSCNSVGVSAFEGCSKFDASADKNNNIVNKLKIISNRAFLGTATAKLESTVADQTIGDYAFSNCTKLTSVKSDAVSVGEYAFFLEGGTSLLESVVLNKLTSMGAHAFDQCRILESVQANKLKTVPAYAFNECSSLGTVKMSEVTTIGDYAFYKTYISKFNSESFEANLQTATSIGKYAFYLSGFGTVNAGSLTKVGDSAFGNSASISTFYAVYIKEIGKEAFMGCSQLSIITDNVADSTAIVDWKTDRSYLTRTERIGMDAFSGTRISDLATGELSVLSSGAFRGMGYLEEVILQGSLQTVSDSAFAGCGQLKNVHLCSSITSIGEGAFAGTSGVKVYAGSETLSGDTSGITVITIAMEGVVSGTVTTVAGNNWTQRRVITGNKFTLPYDDEGNSKEMVLVLTVESGGKETKYQLLAGRSGDVITAYPEINSSMTFGERMEGDVGFEIQATFNPSTVFGDAQTVWNITKYAQTISLPVPLDGIVEGAKFTHYYGIYSNRTYTDPNGAATIQSPIPVTICFYETEFELKSSQDKYKITLNYNSTVATGHDNETFEKQSGELFNLPNLPNVNGYTAVGWFYDALGTKPAPASFKVSKSQTFYAYYTPKTVTVTIMHEGSEMAKVESKQYVKLIAYNRGDTDNPGYLYVKGVNGLNQTVVYSDGDTSDYFDPSVYGNKNGYDFYYYTINSAKYADDSSSGSSTYPSGETLSYTDVIVEVFYTERTYDIKIQNYDMSGNPLAIAIKVDGVAPVDGYWKKELNFQQVQYGITFPIQKISASGWTFNHAGVFVTMGGTESQIGPYYGMDSSYTQSDIVINLDSFSNQRELTLKLFFETGKYVIRYNTTDCSETFSVKNSPALSTETDIRQYLISAGGTGTHGYKFIEWQFNGTKVETLVGETGYFTQEMIDYGMAHNNYIDFEALWTINKYAVKFVITDADGSNGISYYSTTLMQIGESFPEKYKDSATGDEYKVADVSIDYYDLVGWKYNYGKDPIADLANATVTMDYLAFASLSSHPVIGGVVADGVLTLTTEWTPAVYTVNFDPACPTSIRFPSTYVTIGESFEIQDPSELTYSLYTIGDPEWFHSGNTAITLRVIDDTAVLTTDMADYADNKVVTFKVFWMYDSYMIEYTFKEDDVTGTVPMPTGEAHQVNTQVTIESAKDPQGQPYLQRVGYTLLGWNYKAGAEYAIVGTTTMSAEMARTANADKVVFFYPVWGAQSYLIQYDFGGGTQGAYAPTSAFFGEDITISAPTYYGHTFTGWTATGLNDKYASVKAGSSYASWNGSLTRATVFNSLTDSDSEPVILTANWNDAEYVIRYDANGGLGAAYGGDLKAKNGHPLTLASNKDASGSVVLSKEGYTFSGWSVDGVEVIGGAGEQIMFSDKISTYVNDDGQVVIYAVWTYNSYTIHYKVQDDATVVDVPSFYDLPVTLGQPERNGYVFTGWKVTDITGGTVSTKARYSVDGSVWMPWSNTSKGAVATYVMNLTASPDAHVYIVGTWAEQEYTLVYNANKGVGTLPAETPGCKVGYEFTLPQSPQLSKNGYSFAGWSFDKVNLITSNTFTLAMAELADKNCRITVYAMWAAGTYSVQVSESEGSEITVLAYYDVSLSVGIPEKPGYYFTGWSSDNINTKTALYSRDGISWFNWTNLGNVIYAGYFMNLGDDGTTVNLDAEWTMIDYTLRYSPNGGVGEVPEDNNIYHIEDSITLASVKDTKLTNGEKILTGWALERDALYTQEISKLEEYMTEYANSSNVITLYAVWSERSYTVTVDIGDATPSEIPMGWTNKSPGIYTKQVEYGTSVEELMESWNAVTLSKEGHKFDCWVYGYDKIVTDTLVVAQYKVVTQSMIYVLAGVLVLIIVAVLVFTRIERR